MPGTTLFPGAIDTFPDITATTQENAAGLEHDVVHNNEAAAIAALEAKVGITNSADAASLDYVVRNLAMQLMQLGSRVGISSSQIARNIADILALQSAPPAFDETRLLSRDARMDVMASAIALLQATPVAAGADPLQTHLNSQTFGS
jgi:hypothetical protein